MIILPQRKDSIIVDSKKLGIWELIKLANQGGIIHLDNNFAIEVTKSDQKWCNFYVHQFSKGIIKYGQSYVPIKKVTEKVEVARKIPMSQIKLNNEVGTEELL